MEDKELKALRGGLEDIEAGRLSVNPTIPSVALDDINSQWIHGVIRQPEPELESWLLPSSEPILSRSWRP